MGFNKKVLSKAVSELGKAKAPAKPRDITVDPMGYWNPANQGKPVRIPGNDITMHNVKAPVWAQPNVGPGVLMEPEKNYNFKDASYVDETQIGRKGGTLKSHRYSKSMSATNKLFAKNKLFQNKKSKIFDPNAEFKTGGSKLGTINLNPNPLSHYELNYGFNLPTEEDGGEADYEDQDLTDEEIQAYRDAGYEIEELPEAQVGGPQNTAGPRAEETPVNVDAMNAMMKARMAIENEFGNPAAQRMVSPNPKTGLNPEGVGTHYMTSMDEYAVPLLQDKGGKELEYNENPRPSKEDIRFRTPEEAQYFAKHYKDVAPMMKGFKAGGYVQHELVKAQGGKTVYSGPNRGLVGPSTPKTNGAPTIANAKILEAERQKAIKQKGLDALSKKIVVPKRKIPANMMEAEQMIERGELYNESISEIKAREKKEADAREAQRVKSLSDYEKRYNNPNYNSFTGLPGESYRDNLAKEAESLDAKFRVSQKDNFFDDYINPAVWIGSMAKNLGEAPKKAKETNSYMPYVKSIAAPLAAGALAGVGSPTTKQFVNKIVNPIAGMKLPKLPKKVPGAPRTGGGNLNAGFSPELIKNFVGPQNKTMATIADVAYFNSPLSKTLNKISPLNWLPGYGKKLEGAVKPLGNVIKSSIKDGNLVEPKSLYNKAKGLVGKNTDVPLTTKINKVNDDIYSARINGSVDGSNLSLGSQNKGFLNKSHNIQTSAGTDLSKVPIQDPGVSLNRRLPFSNRYVPIDKQKLMNNQFQWSTTGAGLQNAAEKFGKTAALMGTAGAAYGAASLYNPNDPSGGTLMDNVKLGANALTPTASEFISDPGGVKFYSDLAGFKKGGDVESWEDELDDEEIRLLEKGGYIVERL
jgi:hypothetical protein